MKFFVKIDGELVEATPEQVFDLEVKLFNEEGEELERPEPEVKEVKTDEGEGDVKEVIDTVTDMFDKVNNKLEAMDGKINEQDKKIKGAFPMFGGKEEGGKETVTYGDDEDGTKEALDYVGKFWDLKRQGVTLKDGFIHPMAVIKDDKTITELTKFFLLVTRSGQRRPDYKALELFEKIYGKTVVGDTGNVFPIPDIVEAEILAFARERSFALQYARVIPMTSEKQSWPRETASATVSWGNTTSESEPTVDEFELDAEELSCWAGVKNSHMADSRSDIVGWLTANLGEAAGLELDNKMFNGLGSDSPFICSGILSADCGYSVTMASGSTAFSNLTGTHLTAMIAELDGLKKEGARFMMNGAILHFVRDLKDDNNRPIFTETVGGGVPGAIWGYPYSEVIKCPGTSGANTAFLAFGNPRYFAVGRRLDTATLDVDPYGLWTTNRTRYKIYQRWALGMALPNGFVRLLTAAS
jgi:HK97 family phage major capsid protein